MPDNIIVALHYILMTTVDTAAAERFLDHASTAFHNAPINRLSRHYPSAIIQQWAIDYWNHQLRAVEAEPLPPIQLMGPLMKVFREYAAPIIEYHDLPHANGPVLMIPANHVNMGHSA